MATDRPGGVTLVAVLTWITGFFGVLGGIFTVIASPFSTGATFFGGVLAIIIGVVTIAVGIGLLSGNNFARFLTTIFLALSAISALWSIFNNGTVWTAIFSLITALIGLALLYTKRASAFFRSN
jgi:fumarate reductase subunit D